SQRSCENHPPPKPLPGQISTEPSAHRSPARSFFGGFPTPAPYTGSIARAGPASETLVWTAPASQGFVAAGTGLVDCGHVSGLGVRPCRPRAQMGYADRVPNITAGSTPQRVSRGVPILGSTDRHLAAVPASARSERGERAFL